MLLRHHPGWNLRRKLIPVLSHILDLGAPDDRQRIFVYLFVQLCFGLLEGYSIFKVFSIRSHEHEWSGCGSQRKSFGPQENTVRRIEGTRLVEYCLIVVLEPLQILRDSLVLLCLVGLTLFDLSPVMLVDWVYWIMSPDRCK